jgi:hypothetical protein
MTIAVALVMTGAATASPPPHPPYVELWNQNSNFGGSVNSQNYESAMEQYDSAAADDFTIPAGQKWFISEVDVAGAYVNGSGPASSVIVGFFGTKNGLPHKVPQNDHDYFTLNCTDNAGSFKCVLPTGSLNKPVVRLNAGTWWVSVVANCNSQTCGTWNWTTITSVTGYQAVWENETGGYDIIECYRWAPLPTCFGGSPADLAFTLIGFSKPD